MIDPGLVVLLGISIVFLGLICIILVCTLMSFIIRTFEKKPAVQAPTLTEQQTQTATAPELTQAPIPSRPELAAAIAAAIAEYTGKDISGIRILSIKKI